MLQRALEGGAENFFVEFCQLTAEADPPITAECFGHILQRVEQLMGGFVKNHGAFFPHEGLQMILTDRRDVTNVRPEPEVTVETPSEPSTADEPDFVIVEE